MVTDLDAFSQFSIKTLLNLPNVKDIHTSFSLGEVKAGGALPLDHLGAVAAAATSGDKMRRPTPPSPKHSKR